MSQMEYRVVWFPKNYDGAKTGDPTVDATKAERDYATREKRGEHPILERRSVPTWEVVRSRTAEELEREMAELEREMAEKADAQP